MERVSKGGVLTPVNLKFIQLSEGMSELLKLMVRPLPDRPLIGYEFVVVVGEVMVAESELRETMEVELGCRAP